ncbi:hypothetical protein JR316_0007452 [Psilocybe cubensis]|uniref:Uncharacterized protein n=1 Tax=Psilocybe cubensis TaxID=181762 RepID=A0ACB8GYN4_PSICU|nr:hypothetical protein JR316_0007452 [Psilocybe cubensis]KAH9480850.1 hypothetical protein JR316_0007452 [Psilocybe cubensis]
MAKLDLAWLFNCLLLVASGLFLNFVFQDPRVVQFSKIALSRIRLAQTFRAVGTRTSFSTSSVQQIAQNNMSEIIFYDIKSNVPGYSVSPTTWRTRYCLNLKGLKYKSQYVEFPEIAPLYKKLGVPAPDTNSDGSPHYTLPMIYDPSTNKYIPDSTDIAIYLDKQYPDLPRIFPPGTERLQMQFSNAAMSSIPAAGNLLTWRVFARLNPISQEYYRRVRETVWRVKLEQMIPDDQNTTGMATLKKVMGKIDALYVRNGAKGPFVLGETPSWADITISAMLVILKVSWGEDSDYWKQVISWNDGRWERFFAEMKKYE